MTDNRELFKGTASYYSRFRLGYPSACFAFLAERLALDGRGRLLDLGCGTGQLAIPLASYFERVLAVDPEPEMLTQAAIMGQRAGVANVEWALGRAEAILPALGDAFRLTTLGSSLHWMNQPFVLRHVYDHTEVGGGIAIVGDSTAPSRQPYAAHWKQVRMEVVARYLGEKRRAGKGFYAAPALRFEDTLLQSPFHACEEWLYEYEHVWTLEETIGFMYSTSSASPWMFGARRDAFERDLAGELLAVEPTGLFREHITVQVLLACK